MNFYHFLAASAMLHSVYRPETATGDYAWAIYLMLVAIAIQLERKEKK